MPEPVRILLVEEDGSDAVAVSRYLNRADWNPEITRVDTEDAFRERVDAGEWDIIVSDMSLPWLGAERVLELLREAGAEIPVIVVSGQVGEEAAVQVLRNGAADFVSKGNLSRLVESVERELRQSAVRREAAEANRALLETEERLEAFVRSAMDAIVSCDEEQRIVMFNPAAEKVFGWQADEVIGQRLDVLLPERYRWIHSAHVRDFGISGVTNRTMANLAPLAGRRKDGSEFPIETTISQAQAGNRRFFTAVVRDISERRRLESELLQAQKMEAIGRLAGGIAHDFNNLLTAITGYTEIAMMEAQDAGLEASLKEVLSAAERASALTRQLLTLSRKQTAEATVLDPNEAVAEIHRMLHRVLGEDIELVSNLDEGVGPIRADRGQLHQILLNLAVNARDAMPGGGRLEIRTFARTVGRDDATVPWPGEYTCISVVDSGTGIPAEDRDRIFEPFYTTKPQGKGTGLGLSIVKNILESHQATITVDDAPTGGTEFTIYFPVSASETDERREPSISPRSLGSETVVVIEDDDSLRQLETAVLQRHGYTVHSFGRPADALSAAIPYVDMLVADVVLPGMSGPAAAASLRNRWPHLKVLYLSGYAGEALTEVDPATHGQSLLQKPFTTQELASRVRELLDGRAAAG